MSISKSKSGKGELFEDLPIQKNNHPLPIEYFEAIYGEIFSGPIPHPEHLERYHKLDPEIVRQVMTLAIKQAEHRQSAERESLSAQLNQSGRGQLFAFIVACLLIMSGAFFGYLGSPGAGATVIGSTLAGAIYVFVSGKRQVEEDLDTKERSFFENHPAALR